MGSEFIEKIKALALHLSECDKLQLRTCVNYEWFTLEIWCDWNPKRVRCRWQQDAVSESMHKFLTKKFRSHGFQVNDDECPNQVELVEAS